MRKKDRGRERESASVRNVWDESESERESENEKCKIRDEIMVDDRKN